MTRNLLAVASQLLLASLAFATPVTTGSITYSGIEGPFNTAGLAGTVPANLALNPTNDPLGPTAFASSVIPGFAFHQIPHLNDGSYGNSASWIGGFGGENNININVTGVGPVSAGYAGIDLKHADTITSFAFGSDNGNYLPSNPHADPNENPAINPGGDTGAYHDRTAGTYYVQYTTDANPASAPDANWLTLGSISLVDNSDDSYRHVYDLTGAVTATGLRLIVPGGDRIDELEIYGSASAVPEPSSMVLLGLGAAGTFVVGRRRRSA